METFFNQNTYRKAGWLIVSLAVLLRVYLFIFNPPPFTFDESVIYHLISHCSFKGILCPQSHCGLAGVHYSPGFLLVTQLMSRLFGNQEFVLRFFSFICGVLAIAAFNILKDRFLSQKAGLLSLFIFSFNGPLIYFGMLAKPYSGDVLSAIVMLFVFLTLSKIQSIGVFQIVFYSAIGALCQFFSNPSVFVIAAVGVVAVLSELFSGRRHYRKIRGLVIISFLWLLFFIGHFQLRLYEFVYDKGLLNTWDSNFLHQQDLWGTFHWLGQRFYALFGNPLALVPILGVFFFVWGFLKMFSKRKSQCLVLLLPLVFMMAACLLNKYVFFGRLLLFLMPGMCLVISQGVEALSTHKHPRKEMIFFVLLSGILMVSPMVRMISQSFYNTKKQGLEPQLAYALSEFKDGDIIYVSDDIGSLFRYYLQKYPIDSDQYIINDSLKYNIVFEELNKLKQYKRIWFFCNEYWGDRDRFIKYELRKFASQDLGWESKESRLYLYSVGTLKDDERKF